MSKTSFPSFLGLRADAIFPLALGAAGIAYYAMQAQAPHLRGASPREVERWEKHVQTGQLIATAALSMAVVLYRSRLGRGGYGGES